MRRYHEFLGRAQIKMSAGIDQQLKRSANKIRSSKYEKEIMALTLIPGSLTVNLAWCNTTGITEVLDGFLQRLLR
jgi:hypothetical protein